MQSLMMSVIYFSSFLLIIHGRLSIGRINRGEYFPINNTTNWTIVYNKSCLECLCSAFSFNLSQQYQGLNCNQLNNSCVLFKNISFSSLIRLNNYSSFYFLASAFNVSATASTLTSSLPTPLTSTSVSTPAQNASTGRYWACCKPSCSWPGKAAVTNPARSCAVDGVTAVDSNTASACDWGTSYMCFNQQPWNVSDSLSYGYVGAFITGQDESKWCCTCYSLTFTSGPIQGKQMIVQAVNTAYTSDSHFALQIPGGGWMASFNACPNQFSGSYSWGLQYSGVTSRSECANLPSQLQPGCYWRFDWFMNANNPSVQYREVTCPSILTANTDCIRY